MSFDLETAAEPANLRRVAIDVVSRVEGHGKVTLLLDDQRSRAAGAPAHRRVPRLREVHPGPPVLGGPGDGAAPVRHLPGQPPARRLQGDGPGHRRGSDHADAPRRSAGLMHYGQIMQSHALHFFLLASPDLLFGFDSDASAAQHRRRGRGASRTSRSRASCCASSARRSSASPSGKRIHGTGSIPGGMNKHVSQAERDLLDQDIDQMIAVGERRGRDHQAAARAEPRALRQLRQLPLQHAVAGAQGDGALDLYDGVPARARRRRHDHLRRGR